MLAVSGRGDDAQRRGFGLSKKANGAHEHPTDNHHPQHQKPQQEAFIPCAPVRGQAFCPQWRHIVNHP